MEYFFLKTQNVVVCNSKIIIKQHSYFLFVIIKFINYCATQKCTKNTKMGSTIDNNFEDIFRKSLKIGLYRG